MCGIVGIWNYRNQIESEHLERFTNALKHRGPDGGGFYLEPNLPLGFGHRRLAILDLSEAGHQPMSYANGRYWITYNGEIYNFLELRRELEVLGYRFQTQTDTEVILAAYARWGVDCQLRFNGMWAFAIWDRQERTLFLSRDRFGIKPLYYLSEPDRFAFASEMKAFLYLDNFIAKENEIAIQRVLQNTFALESSEESLIKGVKRLLGGHCMVVRPEDVKVWRWWNTLDHLSSVPPTLAEQAEQFQELFFDACRLRLRSDVPVGTCLSGGVDSSAVLCTLADISTAQQKTERCTDNWQRAFVATFPGTPLDERHYAEIAVQQSGAKPLYKPMSADTALDKLEQVIYDFEDIYLTLPTPVWAIYRELRRDGVVVSLDGHGADEMLAGYGNGIGKALQAAGGFLGSPRRSLDLINTWQNLYAKDAKPKVFPFVLLNDPSFFFISRLVKAIYRRTVKPLRRHRSVVPLNEPWVKPMARGLVQTDRVKESTIDALGPVNASLYRDFHRNILPTILRNYDRCSMAHGIEVRMPFMDWRLVCFVFSLPEESKIGGGFTKRVLREAMRGVMPEPLRTRKGKIGFNSPLPDWFNGGLRSWVWEQVNHPDFLQSEIWNGPAIRRFVEARQASGNWQWSEAERLWPYLHAHTWQQTFCRRERVV